MSGGLAVRYFHAAHANAVHTASMIKLKATCRFQNIILMNVIYINYTGIDMKIPANTDLFKSVYIRRKTGKNTS